MCGSLLHRERIRTPRRATEAMSGLRESGAPDGDEVYRGGASKAFVELDGGQLDEVPPSSAFAAPPPLSVSSGFCGRVSDACVVLLESPLYIVFSSIMLLCACVALLWLLLSPSQTPYSAVYLSLECFLDLGLPTLS